MYNPKIHHLHIALCVHHPKSISFHYHVFDPLDLLLHFPFPLPLCDHKTIIYVYEFLLVLFIHFFTSVFTIVGYIIGTLILVKLDEKSDSLKNKLGNLNDTASPSSHFSMEKPKKKKSKKQKGLTWYFFNCSLLGSFSNKQKTSFSSKRRKYSTTCLEFSLFTFCLDLPSHNKDTLPCLLITPPFL